MIMICWDTTRKNSGKFISELDEFSMWLTLPFGSFLSFYLSLLDRNVNFMSLCV